MKVNEKWLREWIDPEISTAELADQLTMAGFEVEDIQSTNTQFTGVVIGRVDKVENHPDADNQKICTVSVGKKKNHRVVCGAEKIKTGSCYPYAAVGAELPGGIKIEQRDIKGVASEGMLCSPAELGLFAETDRILELDSNAIPGNDFADYLQANDHVLELSLTPNRGDCLSVRGIAREVAAMNKLELSVPEVKKIPPVNRLKRKIILDAPEACPRYVGRIIRGIDIDRVAPVWMTEKLRRCGLRSINPIVDISNLVMLEIGQPMHAFDDDKLQGDIHVGYAINKESITLLDEQTHQLDDDILTIRDENGAVALAGIMGGHATAVTGSTTNVFLECAFFTAEYIAGRARRFGMHTDASHRYERGVDYELQESAVEMATRLILEVCGGEPGPIVQAVSRKHLPKTYAVRVEYSHINSLLGEIISPPEIVDHLNKLDLSVKTDETGVSVTVPSFRFDLSIPEDLIEEIARLHGYHKISSQSPTVNLRMGIADETAGIDQLRRVLVNRGYFEAITYSFVDAGLQSRMLARDDAIPLLNPISSELGVMRQSLLPGLLLALQYNLKRQQQNIRLFEYGLVFTRGREIEQSPRFSGLISGEVYKKQWDKDAVNCDFFDIKGDVEAVINHHAGHARIQYRATTHPALHPGQCAEITDGDQRLGLLGAIHPEILDLLDIDIPVYVFELDFHSISEKIPARYQKFSKFPSIRRDIAILVDADIPVAEIVASVENTAPAALYNLELFDVYQGEGIDLGKKSLALGLTFQDSSSTLTDEEVTGFMTQVVESLHTNFGAKLRE